MSSLWFSNHHQNKTRGTKKGQGKMRFRSNIEISGDTKVLAAYRAALKPEQSNDKRAGYRMRPGKGKFTIELQAADANAFRALLNSLTGLIAIVDKTRRVIEHGKD